MGVWTGMQQKKTYDAAQPYTKSTLQHTHGQTWSNTVNHHTAVPHVPHQETKALVDYLA